MTEWVLVMWLYAGGAAPEMHGLTYHHVEQHLSKEGCELALSELKIARGQVASAECEPARRAGKRAPRSAPLSRATLDVAGVAP